MWVVADLKTELRSFSFESSGQGDHRDLALVADGVTLVNMMRRVEWSDDPMQIRISREPRVPRRVASRSSPTDGSAIA